MNNRKEMALSSCINVMLKKKVKFSIADNPTENLGTE